MHVLEAEHLARTVKSCKITPENAAERLLMQPV